MDDKASPTLPPEQIRRTIGILTPVVWVSSTVTGVILHGETFPHAAVISFIFTLSWLLAWRIYLLISRRPGVRLFDVWVLVGMAPSVATMNRVGGTNIPSKEEFIACAFFMSFWALFACIMGLALRDFPKDDRKPVHSPLWDSEIDS